MPTLLPSVKTFTAPSASSPVDPADNPTQAAAYWLRRDIVRGVFLPTEPLRVQHLCELYEIGLSPVREAILILSSTGLVEHIHQRGHRAAPVSLADYQDLFQVFRQLYRSALAASIANGDDAWEEDVVVALHRLLKAKVELPQGDPERHEIWQKAYVNLHQSILSGCGSPIMLKLLDDLGARLERYVNLYSHAPADLDRDHHNEHRSIVDALLKRDGEALQSLIETHFIDVQPVHNSVVDALQRLEASAKSEKGSKAMNWPRKSTRAPLKIVKRKTA